jgi:hypothetical protein
MADGNLQKGLSQLDPPGPTPAATSGKCFNRHSFIYKVIRRDVTPDDRTRDKGNRRYRTLHAQLSSRKDGITRPDSTYSIYEARYPLDKVDEVEEAGLGPEPLEPWERLVNGAVVAADDDPNIPYTEFDSLDSYDDLLDLERIEVLSCRNKFDPKMLDLILDPLSISEEARRTQIGIREGIVADMKDESTPLGKIVTSIAGFENAGRGSGAELRSHFVEFANAVAMRFAGSAQESTEQHDGGTFQSGNSFKYSGHDIANKVYICVRDLESSGFEDVSFGEVKVSMAADLKDSLLGRVLVQLVSVVMVGWNRSNTNSQTICAAQITPKTRGCRPCFLLHTLWPGHQIVARRLHPIRNISWLLIREPRRLRENRGHRCFLERARPFNIGTMETSASGFSDRHTIIRWQCASL